MGRDEGNEGEERRDILYWDAFFRKEPIIPSVIVVIVHLIFFQAPQQSTVYVLHNYI
jgi:hypothetical protein